MFGEVCDMDRRINENDIYNRPLTCEKCGGIMIFKGVGEYHCENCRHVEYDDYGKVRLYVEKHRGATSSEVSMQTGVSQKAIRQMLKENRLEITQDSAAFLRCEVCGASIRGGRLCPKCEMDYHRRMEDEQRRQSKMQGFGKAMEEEEGAKRFHRNY
jgi:DNA-directed RNA polymerase subunit M/transcription elongation factor TFIIS